jgi:hypothetical protein
MHAQTAADNNNYKTTTYSECLPRDTHARVRAAQWDTHKREQSITKNNRTQCCAVTQQPLRDEVQQRTRDNANPQSQHCALVSARMTQPRLFGLHIFAILTHMPNSAALPATVPSHHVHTRAQTHTTQQATPSTTARQRHGACHPKQRTKTTRSHVPHSALTRSTQTHKPRTPAGRPTQPRRLRTAQTSLHAHRRTHTAHSTAHRQLRGLRATLTAELSGCLASTGCRRTVGCPARPTPCTTHDQPSHHAAATDVAADPSQSPKAHLSTSHSINRMKSSQIE